jgi:glutamate-ammonia-ligase adenylyltransferase
VPEGELVEGGLPPVVRDSVARAASPPAVRVALRRLAGVHPGLLERLEGDDDLRRAVVAVTAASRSLTRLLVADPGALDVLVDLDRRPPAAIGDADSLLQWKRREYLRITARDLSGLDDLPTTTAQLSRLACDVLDHAIDLTEATDLSVIGMGKLGGDELNYASDIDLMFVGDGDPDELERHAREVIDLTGHAFRVDTTLRPEGRSGPLVRSLESYEAYWDRWAEPWEFQALLKARPVAGDRPLGARFADTAQRWLWNRPFRADDLRSLRAMKERTEGEVARRGLTDRDVKLGRGGLRDIEFAVQLLQLVHGQVDADLRSPNTLEALGELAGADYVDPSDARELHDAYCFLRDVEHRLQLVDEQQVHTVPDDPVERDHLARVLGFRDIPRERAVQGFEHRLLEEQLTVRLIHERIYFRPLLEAFAGSEGALTPEAAATRSAAFGFTDARRTQDAVRELTRGLNRSSRLMQQLLPLMLDWLSQSPDPDLGLLMLRNVLTGPQRTTQLIEAFRESTEVARRLCQILGTSRLLGDILIHHPDTVPRLADPDRLQTSPRTELVAAARTAVEGRTARTDRQEALLRWQQRNLVGIAARDLFDLTDVQGVGADLTSLAESTLQVALECVYPALPMCVVALGRFGGAELSYASDVDVVFVYEGGVPSAAAEAERVSRDLLRFVNGDTPAERIYEIDASLRPEGKQGPLARSLGGFASYFGRWAEVWERQAFVRARVAAGDPALGERLIASLAPSIWERGLSSDEVREIRRLKARVESERIPVGEDPEFHLKLGRGSLSDIEWTAQLLQLQHGVHATGTIDALARLSGAGILDPDDRDLLTEAYTYLERTRNRLYLVQSAPGDSLPSQPEQLTRLARSLDTTPAELREQYRRVTRRARAVFERLFYGRE